MRDVVTGELILPDPFVYFYDESSSVKQRKKPTYVYGPIEMPRKELFEELVLLKENLGNLEKYVTSINTKRTANNLERITGRGI